MIINLACLKTQISNKLVIKISTCNENKTNIHKYCTQLRLFPFSQLQSTEESYKKSLEASESRNMDLENTLIKLEEEQQR